MKRGLMIFGVMAMVAGFAGCGSKAPKPIYDEPIGPKKGILLTEEIIVEEIIVEELVVEEIQVR